MRRRAVSAQKGGVAKTTTVANLAAAWGARGRRVLAIDCDPQFDLTRALGTAPSRAPATLVQVLAGSATVDGAVVRDVMPGVDLLAGHRDLRSLEVGLAGENKREEYLKRALADVDGYDELLIDCPPNLGLLTVNALFAAREVLLPVSMKDSSALQSAAEVRRTVAVLAERDVDITITAAIRTMVDRRRLAYQAIDVSLQTLELPITATEIPLTAAFDNSIVSGRPLVAADPTAAGARAYIELADELAAKPARAAAAPVTGASRT
jgi:chromosome partitioning protein